VVVAVNGAKVRTSSELTREVAKASPGEVLRLDVLRMGKSRTVEIRSGVRPSEKDLVANDNQKDDAAPGKGGSAAAKATVVGLTLAPLDDAGRRRLGVDGAVKGLVITTLDPNSDAAQKGVRPDDILVRAGDREITSADDFANVVEAAKKAGRQSVLVGIYRGGRTLFLPLKVSG
jgi:serine protease Do